AARGGYTAVCAMPNLNPIPDTKEKLLLEKEIIKRDALIGVYPYAAITMGESGQQLSEMSELSEECIAFCDDGKGVQNGEMMKSAMVEAKKLGKLIAAHCEEESLLNGGYIHMGKYAEQNGHAGICSESEWKPIARDIALLRETHAAYHVCHISTKESVELIRKAKAEGLDITCETGPHYLLMNDMMLRDEGRFKMNPPIRSEKDRVALIEGLCDGTIDMIATDHAPHSAEEKSKGLKGSSMGVVGIETAFSLLYTYLVETGVITLEKLIELMCKNPAERFKIEYSGLRPGDRADFTVYDLEDSYAIDPDEFLSKGKATPFEGVTVSGRCLMTVCGGRIVWKYEK
ncbi:MAG: dihydroorotase, partial [Oscillospiraceae bacterium]|nr:dihydroorotase [Oscillospiraceae bacterium]